MEQCSPPECFSSSLPLRPLQARPPVGENSECEDALSMRPARRHAIRNSLHSATRRSCSWIVFCESNPILHHSSPRVIIPPPHLHDSAHRQASFSRDFKSIAHMMHLRLYTGRECTLYRFISSWEARVEKQFLQISGEPDNRFDR